MTKKQSELIELITAAEGMFHVEAGLAVSIAWCETRLDPWKTRFEPAWRYLYLPISFAEKLGISQETEKTLQSFSWGPMQIMGSVAREIGYVEQLPALIDPKISVPLSCQKLVQIKKKYSNLNDVIASYNAGSPRKGSDGKYVNQAYVDGVLYSMDLFKKGKLNP